MGKSDATAPNQSNGDAQHVNLEKLKEDYGWFSQALTNSTRIGVISLVGALWAILTTNSITLLDKGVFGLETDFLGRAIFLLAGITLITDFIQYLAALWMSNIGIDRYEDHLSKKKKVEFSYDKEHLGNWGITLYWINFWCFPLKIIAALLCFMSFILLSFAIDFNLLSNVC